MKPHYTIEAMQRKFAVLVYQEEDGTFWGEVAQLPGCFSQGDTVEQLLERMKEAIQLYLETEPAAEEKPFFGIRELTV